MKKPILILTCCLIFSAALVVVLYALSDNQIRKHNSFLRIILKNPFNNIGGMDLKFNSYYLSGASNDKLYLGNYTAPLHLLTSNFQLTDTQSVVLSIHNIEKLKYKSPRLSVVPPYFYIMDGSMPSLYRGDLREGQADSFMFDKAAYFIDAIPVGTSTFAIRTTSSLTQELALGKIIPDTPYVKVDTTLLQKQIDGKFCTDGMLLYDRELARIVYLYNYRNQYIVADTSLNLLYRGTTIDTVTYAQIATANISSDKTYTMAAPPLSVNDASCVANGLLFVKSPLLSKNETEETFRRMSVVDVYDLKEGAYKFSFYVPKFDGKSFEEFKVSDNKLIVRYAQRIETYQLNPQYFPPAENKVITANAP